MPTVKTVSLGLVIWAASVTVVHADPYLSTGGIGTWFLWGHAGSVQATINNSTYSTSTPTSLTTPTTSTPLIPAGLFNNLPMTASTTPYPTPQPVAPMMAAPVTQVAPAPSPAAVPAPIDYSSYSVDPTKSGGMANAYINLGGGPYPNAAGLTTGNAQPWFNSSQINGFFGGPPTAQQQAAFDATVLQRVQQTFQMSGVPVTLTDNPAIPAAHTLSVVSNTSPTTNGAIGLTYLGANGFNFIDQTASQARSLDQLEWIVAHNVSHELMIAFGVGEKYDTSGNFVDARNANWTMMVDPNATFSSGASQALLQALTPSNQVASTSFANAQVVDVQPVPEPATLLFWGLSAAAAIVYRRRSTRALAR